MPLVRQTVDAILRRLLRLGIPTTSPRTIRTLPHDPAAFTQGLHYVDGTLYESTGLVGHSTLRRLSVTDGTVEHLVRIDADHTEGIAVLDGRLYQLAWKSGVARVYSIPDLKEVDRLSYEGEGWGLTASDAGLIMSNGTSTVQKRDAELKMTGTLRVRSNGIPLTLINDMAYAEGSLYANVWWQWLVYEIDAATGRVTGAIDCTSLAARAGVSGSDHVLNGIAYNPDARSFFLTGKRWPLLFEIASPRV